MEEKNKCGVFTDELHKQNRTQKEILEKIDKIEKQNTDIDENLTIKEKQVLKKSIFDYWNNIYLRITEEKQKKFNYDCYIEGTFNYSSTQIQFTSIENRKYFINKVIDNSNLSKNKKILAIEYLTDNYSLFFKQFGKKCIDYEKSIDEQYLIDNDEKIAKRTSEYINNINRKNNIRITLSILLVITVTIIFLIAGWIFKGIAIIILAIILMCGKSK